MKTLIFSATHLTQKFDPKFHEFLVRLISSVDRVIINGDFWDGQSCTFDDFVKSQWKKLFPLLKSKETIYLYGNHDRKSYSDGRVNLFSDIQSDSYSLPTTNYTLALQHGHEIVPFGDKEERPIVLRHARMNNLYEWGERLATKLSGGHFLRIYRIFNKKMKLYIRDNLRENEILVTGHIHAPEFDLKNRYINTFIRHHKAYYIIVDNNNIIFKKESF
jgi:predicted phosphodiesterase